MAVTYQNTLNGLNDPEQIMAHTHRALDPFATYQERHGARSWLLGAIKVTKKRTAISFMKQTVLLSQKIESTD